MTPDPDDSVRMIAPVLKNFGCPDENLETMARQLDKRARQLSMEFGKTYEESLAHLLTLIQTSKNSN